MKHTEESKAKMRLRKHSPETRSKMSAALKGLQETSSWPGRPAGWKHTPETREKMRESALHRHRGKDKPIWNKGLTKEDPRVAQNGFAVSKTMKQKVAEGTLSFYNPTLEQRAATSARMSTQNPGGRCKWFQVGSESVQGTWERDLALRMEALGILWHKRKPNRSWKYTTPDGVQHRYTPDFFLPEANLKLEVKGYWWGQDRAKMELVRAQNPGIRLAVVEDDSFSQLLKISDKNEFIIEVSLLAW